MGRLKSRSALEEALALELKHMGLPPFKREFRFHPERRWRFDFAFPEHKVAVEIEGGTWTGGRHNRPGGYAADCSKYNEAALLGWYVYRFTRDDVIGGHAAKVIEKALANATAYGDE